MCIIIIIIIISIVVYMRKLPGNWELKLTEHEAQLARVPKITVGKNYRM